MTRELQVLEMLKLMAPSFRFGPAEAVRAMHTVTPYYNDWCPVEGTNRVGRIGVPEKSRRNMERVLRRMKMQGLLRIERGRRVVVYRLPTEAQK